MTAEQATQSARPLTWAFAWGWLASNLRPSDNESLTAVCGVLACVIVAGQVNGRVQLILSRRAG
jgi:hypothetical protein